MKLKIIVLSTLTISLLSGATSDIDRLDKVSLKIIKTMKQMQKEIDNLKDDKHYAELKNRLNSLELKVDSLKTTTGVVTPVRTVPVVTAQPIITNTIPLATTYPMEAVSTKTYVPIIEENTYEYLEPIEEQTYTPEYRYSTNNSYDTELMQNSKPVRQIVYPDPYLKEKRFVKKETYKEDYYIIYLGYFSSKIKANKRLRSLNRVTNSTASAFRTSDGRYIVKSSRYTSLSKMKKDLKKYKRIVKDAYFIKK